MTIRLNLFIFFLFLSGLSLYVSLFKSHSVIINDPSLANVILYSVRLPQTWAAFVTGGLLALSGAQMQILLKNPLADPYILGISGGAGVATLILILCGASSATLICGAWAGSLLTIILVFFLGKRHHQRILLSGVAVASGCAAMISFILLISPDHALRGMLFWLMGDVSGIDRLPIAETGVLFCGLLLSFVLAKPLNILLRGEQAAKTLGVNPSKLVLLLFFMSAGLTASAVTMSGCVGFVGLIVPHMLRLLGFRDLRWLFPTCVLLGGTLVTTADIFSRIVFAPQQLPIGIFMAMLGVPVFLILLHKTS